MVIVYTSKMNVWKLGVRTQPHYSEDLRYVPAQCLRLDDHLRGLDDGVVGDQGAETAGVPVRGPVKHQHCPGKFRNVLHMGLSILYNIK